MEEKLNNELFWNKASLAGLVLGSISIAYMYLGHLINTQEWMAGLAGSMIVFLLWFAKFIGCIWVMKTFMMKYVNAVPDAERKHAFRFGAMAAVMSSLLYATVVMADAAFISPEIYRESADLLIKTQEEMGMTSAGLEQVKLMFQKMPQYMFFANFIIYAIYGTILSLILSNTLISNDPFKNQDIDGEHPDSNE